MKHIFIPITELQDKEFAVPKSKSFFIIESFPPENYEDDIDIRSHRLLMELSKKYQQNIDSITLPISFTKNYLDFSGLIFAHHVRLTRNLPFADVPIIFYGSLDILQILKISPLARILLTPNVEYVNMSKYSFEQIEESLKKYQPKEFKIEEFIDFIQLTPPPNYDSHHSIDNEFALIQWSKYIDCYNDLPKEFKKEFDSRLYFKYLQTKKNLPEVNDKKQFFIDCPAKTKILLIDDEYYKGWESFYSSFFSHSPSIEFHTLKIDFKNQPNENALIESVKKSVIEKNIDIILLDLRLLDSDFEETTKIENITGIKLIECIKEINKGIQIIFTTASNKAWTFNIAKQKGAFDFIIKDGYENPGKNIERLKSSIEICAKRSKFLKKVFTIISKIKQRIDKNKHFDCDKDEIRYKTKLDLDIAFDLLDLSAGLKGKEKYFAYSYLQFFICIENFVGQSSTNKKANPIFFEKNEQYFISHPKKTICFAKKDGEIWQSRLVFKDGKYSIDNEIKNIKKPDTNFLVSAVLIYYFGNGNSSVNNWTKLYKLRNNIAHKIDKIPDRDSFLKLLNFIEYFFCLLDENEKNTNIEKGIVPRSNEENLKRLQEKYKKD